MFSEDEVRKMFIVEYVLYHNSQFEKWQNEFFFRKKFKVARWRENPPFSGHQDEKTFICQFGKSPYLLYYWKVKTVTKIFFLF